MCIVSLGAKSTTTESRICVSMMYKHRLVGRGIITKQDDDVLAWDVATYQKLQDGQILIVAAARATSYAARAEGARTALISKPCYSTAHWAHSRALRRSAPREHERGSGPPNGVRARGSARARHMRRAWLHATSGNCASCCFTSGCSSSTAEVEGSISYACRKRIYLPRLQSRRLEPEALNRAMPLCAPGEHVALAC